MFLDKAHGNLVGLPAVDGATVIGKVEKGEGLPQAKQRTGNPFPIAVVWKGMRGPRSAEEGAQIAGRKGHDIQIRQVAARELPVGPDYEDLLIMLTRPVRQMP